VRVYINGEPVPIHEECRDTDAEAAATVPSATEHLRDRIAVPRSYSRSKPTFCGVPMMSVPGTMLD